MNLALAQDKTKCLGCFLHLRNLVFAPPDDEPGGQELEQHGERGGGGRHGDGHAFFEIN